MKAKENKKEENGRRNFIGNLSKITLVGASLPLVSAVPAPHEKSEKVAFLCNPYLQDVTKNSAYIMFLTTINAYSWVEYGENGLDFKAESYSDGFVTANNRLNNIRLQNLKPGTKYKYRAVVKEIINFDPYDLIYGETIMGDIQSFRTPEDNSEKVSCVILNDIHDRPYSFVDLLSMDKNFQYDFVAFNGDMFDYQTDEQQLIDHLIEPCTALFASEKPFLMIRGNHETRGKYARNIKDYFAYPKNEFYFSFKQGPVHWIVLDTGEDKEDTDPEYGGIVSFDPYREAQATWLEKEFRDPKFNDCKYRVVLMHIPVFHSGDWHGTLHCRKLFHPIFEKNKVDMVISGHTHRYGVHPPSEEHSYPIIIGGGPKTGNRTIIQLKADALHLTINMIRDDGLKVGEYTVD